MAEQVSAGDVAAADAVKMKERHESVQKFQELKKVFGEFEVEYSEQLAADQNYDAKAKRWFVAGAVARRYWVWILLVAAIFGGGGYWLRSLGTAAEVTERVTLELQSRLAATQQTGAVGGSTVPSAPTIPAPAVTGPVTQEEGERLINAGKHPEAIALFTEFIRLNPEKSIGYFLRGKAYRLNKQYDLAKADQAKAREVGLRATR
ncbi:MAG: hypothetical protein Greene041619_499 [Candidatus Peregrinibacteria bacterium Greene0416_19]|nr:MAG: hypothetical protein Greene041619_499 [Candidatus Peregrinibacteria bacterium Greene0416_19]